MKFLSVLLLPSIAVANVSYNVNIESYCVKSSLPDSFHIYEKNDSKGLCKFIVSPKLKHSTKNTYSVIEISNRYNDTYFSKGFISYRNRYNNTQFQYKVGIITTANGMYKEHNIMNGSIVENYGVYNKKFNDGLINSYIGNKLKISKLHNNTLFNISYGFGQLRIVDERSAKYAVMDLDNPYAKIKPNNLNEIRASIKTKNNIKLYYSKIITSFYVTETNKAKSLSLQEKYNIFTKNKKLAIPFFGSIHSPYYITLDRVGLFFINTKYSVMLEHYNLSTDNKEKDKLPFKLYGSSGDMIVVARYINMYTITLGYGVAKSDKPNSEYNKDYNISIDRNYGNYGIITEFHYYNKASSWAEVNGLDDERYTKPYNLIGVGFYYNF